MSSFMAVLVAKLSSYLLTMLYAYFYNKANTLSQNCDNFMHIWFMTLIHDVIQKLFFHMSDQVCRKCRVLFECVFLYKESHDDFNDG